MKFTQKDLFSLIDKLRDQIPNRGVSRPFPTYQVILSELASKFRITPDAILTSLVKYQLRRYRDKKVQPDNIINILELDPEDYAIEPALIQPTLQSMSPPPSTPPQALLTIPPEEAPPIPPQALLTIPPEEAPQITPQALLTIPPEEAHQLHPKHYQQHHWKKYRYRLRQHQPRLNDLPLLLLVNQLQQKSLFTI